jgi:uncharacterized glyoxalase superfamily protein PhnB
MSKGITGLSVNIFVPDSRIALRYYEKVFEAKTIKTYFTGKLGENAARFLIGEYLFAMADENKELGSKSPKALGGVSACIQLFVEDIEAIVNIAVNEGAKISAPCTEEKAILETPEGVKFCNITDPFGHVWSISKNG